MDPKIKILIEEYNKYPCGGNALFNIVKNDHPEIHKRFVKEFVSNYEPHQLHMSRKSYTQSANIITSKSPLDRLQVDLTYVDKLKGYNNQILYWLTCVDHYSGKGWIRTLTNRKSETVSKKMEEILDSINGQVKLINMDNGSEFQTEFTDMLTRRKIKYLFSNSASPWTQGKVESFNGHIKNVLYRWMTANQTNRYVEVLQELVDRYNKCVNFTGYCPDDIFYGVSPKPVIDDIHDKINVKKLKQRMNDKVYKIGDTVRIDVDILYNLLPDKYKRPTGTFRKNFHQNFSIEVFKIERVITNSEYIHGYHVSYQNEHFSYLVRPHHIRPVDTNKLVKSTIPINPNFKK